MNPDIIATAALSRDGLLFLDNDGLRVLHANSALRDLLPAAQSILRDGTEIKQFLAYLAKNAEFVKGDSVAAVRDALATLSGQGAAELPVFRLDGQQVTWRCATGPAGTVAVVLRVSGRAEELAKALGKALADHKIFIQHLIDVLPTPVYLKNLDGVINRCNSAFSDLLGLTPDKVIGKRLCDVAPASLAELISSHENTLKDEEGSVRDKIAFSAGGDERVALFAASRLKAPSGAIAGTIGSLIDVTSLKKAQAEVAAAAERLTGLLQKAPIGVGISSRDNGAFKFFNSTFSDLLSLGEDEDFNDSILVSERYREQALKDMDQLGELKDVELRIRRAGRSEARWLKTSLEPLEFGGENAVLWWVSDITKQKHAARELQHKANNDVLTGLANRARFMQRLAHFETVLRGTETQASIFMLDLDGFKGLNDRAGHAAGDWVLVETAKRLKRAARRADEIARLGGDEFTLVLVNKGGVDAMSKLADDIQAEFSKPFVWEGEDCKISASIGYAVFNGGDCDMNEQLRRADKAMYEAKASGKACSCLYRPELEPELHRDEVA